MDDDLMFGIVTVLLIWVAIIAVGFILYKLGVL